jgi:ABC-type uncharacterized transport system permease subunit
MILTSDLAGLLATGWWAGWLAALTYCILAIWAPKLPRSTRLTLWGVAWVAHGWALAASLFDGHPRFGFGPALSATAWLVLCVYAVESRALPRLQSHRGTVALAAMAVVLANLFPGADLAPASSVWQPVHWALGIASYGLFAAAVIHGALMSAAERRMRSALEPRAGLPVLTLERLTFHLVAAGFVSLTLTLAMAIFKADVLYGMGNAHWRWDHKTVLSLASWLVFAVLLLGRHVMGWRGPKAVRFLYLGAACLFLAYVGSHFVKEVLLQR